MDRRTFVGTLAGSLFAAPLAGAQQPGKVYRIGVVAAGVNPRSASFFQAFEQLVDFQTPSRSRDP